MHIRKLLTSALSGSLQPRRVWCRSRRRCWYGLLALKRRILERPLMIVVMRKRRSWLRARVRAFATAVWAVLLRGGGWRIYGTPAARCHHCSSPNGIHWRAREQVRIGVVSVRHAHSCASASSRVVVVSEQKVFLARGIQVVSCYILIWYEVIKLPWWYYTYIFNPFKDFSHQL